MTASISDASDTSPVAPSGEDDGQAEGRAEDTSINGPAPETGDEADAIAGIDDDSDAAQGPGPRPEADSRPGAPLEHCEALGLSIRAFNTEGPFGVGVMTSPMTSPSTPTKATLGSSLRSGQGVMSTSLSPTPDPTQPWTRPRSGTETWRHCSSTRHSTPTTSSLRHRARARP